MPTLQGFLPLFEATFRLVRQLDPLLGRAPLDLRQPSRQCPLQVQVRGQVSTYRRPLRQRPLNVALLPEAFLRPRPRLRLLRLLDDNIMAMPFPATTSLASTSPTCPTTGTLRTDHSAHYISLHG